MRPAAARSWALVCLARFASPLVSLSSAYILILLITSVLHHDIGFVNCILALYPEFVNLHLPACRLLVMSVTLSGIVSTIRLFASPQPGPFNDAFGVRAERSPTQR
jgi:hypothetical protein